MRRALKDLITLLSIVNGKINELNIIIDTACKLASQDSRMSGEFSDAGCSGIFLRWQIADTAEH